MALPVPNIQDALQSAKEDLKITDSIPNLQDSLSSITDKIKMPDSIGDLSGAMQTVKDTIQKVNESRSFLDEMIATQAQTGGSDAGKTDTKTITKIFQKTEKLIKGLDGSSAESENGDSKLNAKNENGEIVQSFGTCPVCGKPLTSHTQSGMCSSACQEKSNLSNVGKDISDEQDKADNIQGKMSKISNNMSGLLNQLSEMQSLLSDITTMGLDPKYLDYFKLRITTIIQYLSYKVLKATTTKNQKMLNGIQKASSGMTSASSKMIAGLDKALAAIEKVKAVIDKFFVVFDKLYEAISQVFPTKLEPETIHFNITPRSAIQVPGKIVNALPNNNINDSMADVHLTDKITNIVDKIFPPMTSSDFVLPPQVFEIKKIFSDENSKARLKMTELLMKFLKGPTEPLPLYKDLSFINFQFLLYLLTSWGPTAMKHYALPLYP